MLHATQRLIARKEWGAQLIAGFPDAGLENSRCMHSSREGRCEIIAGNACHTAILAEGLRALVVLREKCLGVVAIR